VLFTTATAHSQVISHTICANDPSVKRYFVTNPIVGATYNWSLVNGGTIVNQNNDTLYVVWGNQPGIYEVNVSTSLGANCESDTATYWIEIIEAPELIVNGNIPVCAGQSITLTASGATPVLWSNGQTGNTATFTPNQPITIWAVGGTGFCKSDTVYTNLNPIPLPIAAFSPDPTIGEIPVSVNFSNQSINAVSYNWSFGNGATSIETNPMYTYADTGTYIVTLTASNELGCSATTSYSFIKAIDAFLLFIPNAFTPNGDQINPVFKPLFSENIDYTLSIYNRWGEQLFGQSGLNISWDGIYRNRLVEEGVYVYQLSFIHPIAMEKKTYRGKVMLIQ